MGCIDWVLIALMIISYHPHDFNRFPGLSSIILLGAEYPKHVIDLLIKFFVEAFVGFCLFSLLPDVADG